jgi:hypothetical protein
VPDYEGRIRVTGDFSDFDRGLKTLERRINKPLEAVLVTSGFQQAQQSLSRLQKSIGDLNKTPLNILTGEGSGSRRDTFRQLSQGAKDFFNSIASGDKSLASTTAGLRQQSAAFRDLADNINFTNQSQKRYFRDFTQGAEIARVKAGKATVEQLTALKDLYQSGTGGFGQDINPRVGGLNQLLSLGKDLPRTKAALTEYRSELSRVYDLVETRSLSGGIIAVEISNVEKELLKIEQDRAEANNQINNVKRASYALTGKQLFLEEENLAAIERQAAARKRVQQATNDLYNRDRALSRDFGVGTALTLRPAGVNDEEVALRNLISTQSKLNAVEEENLAAVERRLGARQAEVAAANELVKAQRQAAGDTYARDRALSRDFGVGTEATLRPAGVSDEDVARRNLISDRTRAAAEASVFNVFSRQAEEIEKDSPTLKSISRNRDKIEAETRREALAQAKNANQASARGRAIEFRRTRGLSFDERLAQRRPDLAPGFKQQPGFFQGSRRDTIGNAIIGGSFPLLFGQGVGASAGGFAGGALGGAIGGSFGFGLSLIGTAVGSAIDTTSNNLKELATSLKAPNDAIQALEKNGFNVGDSIKFQVQQLQSVGRAYDAQTLVLREVEKRLGPGAAKELGALNTEQKKLQESWSILAGDLQRLVIPGIIGFTIVLNDIVSLINSVRGGGQDVDKSRRNYRFNPLTGKLTDIGEAPRSRIQERIDKAIASSSGRPALSAEDAFKDAGTRIDESRKAADDIKSAYREAFKLQRQAHDLQRDGADLNREIADYSYKKEREIFDLRQQALEKQIENARGAAQNRIERSDLGARGAFASAVGFEQQLLSNVREVMRTRREGEADIEQSRRRLELTLVKLGRDAEDYKRTNAREIEDIERRKLAYVRSVEDYRKQVADYVYDRFIKAADYMRQAMTLPDMGAGGGASAGAGAPGSGAVGPAGAGVAAGRYIQGGWGPGGPNQYGAHFDIAERSGAYFGRGALDPYVLVNGAPLSRGLTVQGGQFGASRDGGRREHRAWDYAFGANAALTLTGGAKWTSSKAGSYGDNTAFMTPDGKVYRIIHGKFEGTIGAPAPAGPQASAAAQISNVPAPAFRNVPIGPTPSAAPVNAARLAAGASLAGGEKEAQRILEDQIKLRQKGVELGQIEQILQNNQLPQLQQQADALQRQIEARKQAIGLSDQAAAVADGQAEAAARLTQIEKDRVNALARAKTQYNPQELVAATKQINEQAGLAVDIAKKEEEQRRKNIELNNQLQNQDRVRSEVLQLQETLAAEKAQAIALERGELKASNVELLLASTLYQQANEAQRQKWSGLVAETEELRKQNEFRRQINELQRDTGLVGAGIRAGFVGGGARAFEQGLRDFDGDASKATDLANRTNLLESQKLVWENLEKNIVDVSSAISGSLTNGLVDIVSGTKKIEDVGREMLRNIAGSFADAAQQQLTSLLQRQLAGVLSGVVGGGGGGGGGFASSLLGAAAPSLIPGFSPSFAFGGFFANGGTTKPGEGYVIGEEGPEFFFPGMVGSVVPRDKVDKAAELRGMKESNNGVIDLRYTVTEQRGERYVTEEQFRKSNAALVQRARSSTYAGMRNSKDVRDYAGI